MIHQDCEIKNVVKIANDLMAEMYGKDWESQPEVEYIPGCGCQHAETFHPLIAEKHDCPNYERVPIVSIAEQDGQKGVRFCIGDVDMFIEAHNLDDGKTYNWRNAMNRLEELGKFTFDKHQMYLMAAYIEQINAKLKEIGGEEIDGYCWSSSENNSGTALLLHFNDGYINYSSKFSCFTVRPCAAFKH